MSSILTKKVEMCGKNKCEKTTGLMYVIIAGEKGKFIGQVSFLEKKMD